MSKNIMSVKDVARMIAEEEGVPWRKVYRACLSIQGGGGVIRPGSAGQALDDGVVDGNGKRP